MRQWAVRLVGITGVTLLSACASQDAHRAEVAVCARVSDTDCAKHSIERAAGEYVEDQGPYDYLLGFVEFDDHGARVERKQLDALLRAIEGEEGDLAIVVYVHGWKHNAADTDNDVTEFRWLLRGLNAAEQASDVPPARRRKVVGVYAGWPGSSLDPGLGDSLIGAAPKQLTFWSRKEAAHRVAKGSVRDLFAAVRDIQARRNGPASGPDADRCGGDTRLVLIGHSFGGLILYDAVNQHLVESARSGLARGPDGAVAGYGNLVVLLNPALEGVAYESIQGFVDARERYPVGQPPVLVTFQSENDWPNRYAFPFGRRVSTLFQRTRSAEQARENRQTIGHIDRFRTHRLVLAEGAAAAPAAPTRAEVSPEGQRAREAQRERALDRLDATRSPSSGRLPARWERPYRAGRVVLRHERHAPDNPFWVVSTDARILSGHNGTWNDDFLLVLNELYTDLVRPADPACASSGRAARGLVSPAKPRAPT